MIPALIAVVGPLKGRRIELSESKIVIGRDRNSGIWISDLMLSRRHCVIHRQGDTCSIEDLESRNGVFVNGLPARHHELEHADRIEIGNSLFVFVSREEEPTISPEEQDEEFEARSTVTLNIAPDAADVSPQAHKHLDVLLRIATAISSVHGTRPLAARLLELMFEVIPARRGTVVLLENNEPLAVATLGSGGGPAAVRPSRTITSKAIGERVAVLANDLHRPQFDHAESLRGAMIHSVLCTPMLSAGLVTGYIYLDTPDPTVRFDETHLSLAGAIAAIAGPAFRTSREIDLLQEYAKAAQSELQGERRLVGESDAIKKAYQLIAKVAPADSTVLIRGESGTGKELAARAIHAASPRASMPFVAVNCAAIPETLMESELFGYEKGAFTGALSQKKGKIETAAGGTLFLDEIGELPILLQSRLLRVLQEREFDRVGGTKPIRIDIRVLAASNRDMEKMVQEGAFRQDLYFRLNVIHLVMPPLRALGDDILLLAKYFVSRFARKCRRRVSGVSPEAQALLKGYDWPGNTRELENAIEHAVVLGTTEQILPEDLPEQLLEAKSSLAPVSEGSYHDAVRDFKRRLVTKAFEGTDWNYAEAASKLGVHPNYLYRLVRNLGLKEP